MAVLLTALVIAAPQARPAPVPQVDVEARQAVPRRWVEVARCESGLRWRIDSGNGYSGGLQWVPSSWRRWRDPDDPPHAWQATAVEEVEAAQRYVEWEQQQGRGGWGPWPVCGRKVGLPQ